MQADARRIAIVVPDLRVGGAQRVLLMLAGEFARRGHEVDLVSCLDDGGLATEIPAGVRGVALLRGSWWLGVRSIAALLRQFRRRRYDAILSSMTGTNLAVVLAHRLAGAGGRVVLREAASLVNLRGRGRRSLRLMRRLYPRADAVVAVSAGVREELVALGLDPARVHAIRNPVDAAGLRRRAQAAPAAPRLRPYLVNVGRLVAQKDHDTLLRAFAASRAAATHDLVIVGEGMERASLSRLAAGLGIAGRVVLAGELTDPYPLMSRAALFVLASRWEGYPNVLLEALALGLPVVATDAPCGASEILAGGRHGALVPMADPVALAAAIDATLDGRQPVAPWPEHDHGVAVAAARYLALLAGGADVEPAPASAARTPAA